MTRRSPAYCGATGAALQPEAALTAIDFDRHAAMLKHDGAYAEIRTDRTVAIATRAPLELHDAPSSPTMDPK